MKQALSDPELSKRLEEMGVEHTIIHVATCSSTRFIKDKGPSYSTDLFYKNMGFYLESV